MAAAAGKWIQDQLLGMQWLKEAVGKALGFLGVDLESRLGGKHPVLPLRCNQDYSAFVCDDFYNFLYSELFSA